MTTNQNIVINKLNERGVTLRDIAEIVYMLQKGYSDITLAHCDESILEVINKREAMHAVIIGVSLDEMAEKKMMEVEINNLILEDNPLFGLDEIFALSIVNMYGSIALTNFGYIDKIKPGIIGKLDKLGKETNKCHTFLDDLICAIAASAASRIAHS